MDFNDLFSDPYKLPLWLGLIAGVVKLFQKELAVFVPMAIREYFADKAARIRDRQEHQQEMEEVTVEALAQSNVTAQLQLIQVNKHLVDFLTNEVSGGIDDIQRILREVRDQSRDNQAQSEVVRIEWSRVVDALGRAERLLSSIEASFRAATEEGGK